MGDLHSVFVGHIVPDKHWLAAAERLPLHQHFDRAPLGDPLWADFDRSLCGKNLKFSLGAPIAATEVLSA